MSHNGSELEIESSDRDFVEQKLSALWTKAGLEDGQIQFMWESVGSGKKPPSLKEFLIVVNPKTATDQTVAIAYFLEKIEGVSEFTVRRPKDEFRKIKFVHSNPSQVLLRAKDEGRLMTAKDPRHYTISRTGQAWVEQRLKK